MQLTKKHQKTLYKIFEKPVRADIVWTDVESMLKAMGAEISEGRGSRVRIALQGVKAVFHRPHPEKETDKGSVVSLRRFLIEAGVMEAVEDEDKEGDLEDDEVQDL
ncbi:MAG: type II toxin-antitoxin system HicA family toxin [Cyanosarcina radialis HA8281-LM2]|jgi:hypothetical protein|nr:type II toxin-antitoxin system HicA family toxin [Cyanosarcina radialis HA8281-LM2]